MNMGSMKTVRGLFEKYWRSSDEDDDEEGGERHALAGLCSEQKVHQLFAETPIVQGLSAIFVNYPLLPNMGLRPCAVVISQKS